VCVLVVGVTTTCAAAVDVWPENPRAATAVNAMASSTVPAATARLTRRNLRVAASRAATAGEIRRGLAIAAERAAIR
jgi:hypothetical protein